jgi:hypothetical protein
VVVSADAKTAYVSVPDLSKLLVFDLQSSRLVAEPTVSAPENLMLSADGETILASYGPLRNPTVASIFDTHALTSVEVPLPAIGAGHTDLTPDAKFGFVAVLGAAEMPSGIVVADIDAATVRTVYPLPGAVWPHAVRYVPGLP